MSKHLSNVLSFTSVLSEVAIFEYTLLNHTVTTLELMEQLIKLFGTF